MADTIASLLNDAMASIPPKATHVAAYGGVEPAFADVNRGERAIDGSDGSDVYPDVFGGGPQFSTRPNPKSVKGQSASGAQGAF